MNRKLRLKGFTMVEAVVATAISVLAISSLVSATGKMTETNARVRDREIMQRIAYEKIQEIVALEDYDTESGDFSDRDIPYRWELERETTSVENVERLAVTIIYTGGDREHEETAYTLIYQAGGS